MERLARADRRHAATIDQWDTDPWLLNTPDGVIDLRTGNLEPHRASNYMTKMTVAEPMSGGGCPLWLATLETITAGNKDLIDYLQRVAGYCLTGSIREHAMFFAYGNGANGKGVVIGTLSGLMGSYAVVASMDAFTASKTERHPTDLAMLRDARLVTAQETEEGRRWAEAKIKSLTGGDLITARFMRQDFFTYAPVFKLLIAGNHRPGLRNVDEAIRRRFNLLPFAVHISPAERDKDLPEKLKAEWSGILEWAVVGCLRWQEIGLQPPAIVKAATDDYLKAEDSLGRWLEESCTTGPSLHSAATELFASWRDWAMAANEYAGSQKAFSQALKARSFIDQRLPTGKAGFIGIGLIPHPSQPGAMWPK